MYQPCPKALRCVLGLMWILGPLPLAAQTGDLTGTITHRDTGEPVSAVQITVVGATIGTISAADGTFGLSNVPTGAQEIQAQRLGFQTTRQSVSVQAGQSATVSFALAPQVLSLQGVVATGLVDPVEGARSPISVGRVTREMMPVPVAGGAVQNLQGLVAGVTMTRQAGGPGGEVGIMLRTPTSVTGGGAPMIVVDGVILGSEGTTNLESLDIQSMEVIRGAAAASLYGSRAAAGVISITTNRGDGLGLGQTRMAVRTELGWSEALTGDAFPRHHQYFVNDPVNPTTYVDANGNPVSRSERQTGPAYLQFMDKPYPGPTFDNFSNIYQGGQFQSHSVSISQNAESTNFALSYSRLDEAGPLENNDGYQRDAFRVNVDHRFLQNLQLGISAYHSRDHLDNVSLSFAQIVRAPRDVDLRQRDGEGNYVQVPDPTVAYENPLWVQGSRDNDRYRVRTLGSARLRWDPIYWLTLSGSVSYDRQDSKSRAYVPKGIPTSITQDIPSQGSISYTQGLQDTWNAELQGAVRQDFGDLNIRLTGRAILEQDLQENTLASGSDFFVQGIPRITAAANRNATSSEFQLRSTGYLGDLAFDFAEKYILTMLLRYDGSSLFGPDDRWHPYYRVAAAWRMAEEDWFNINGVDEFKLRYARGTAGGRPPFAAQYETWSVGASGVSKGTLGNTLLRPEHTTEQEVSVEAILAGRFSAEVTYAWQRTEDQLVDVDLPAFTGYSSQWSNVGVVTGNTIEATLEAQLMQRQNFSWFSTVVFDRSSSKIEEWPIACRTLIWRLWCEGLGMYEIWGSRHLTSPEELAAEGGTRDTGGVGHLGGAIAQYRDQFQVNDDGWLVWVGEGNAYTDGIANDLWGTSGNLAGETFNWGMPIFNKDVDGNITREEIGDGEHMNLGWINAFRWGQFSMHSHFHAVIGGDIVNQLYRTLRLVDQAPEMDQAGKPEGLKKPVAYYTALEGGRGNNSNREPLDYLKLRSLSVNYRLSDAQVDRFGLSRVGVETLSLGLVGRNLLNLNRCTCIDPEQGWDVNTRLGHLSTGATSGGFPNTRNFTAEVSVTF